MSLSLIFPRCSFALRILFSLTLCIPTLGAIVFPLRDTASDTPAFKAAFLASYGVNSQVEPTLSVTDKLLFDKILPYIVHHPITAIEMIKQETTKDANPAFDFLLGNLYYQIDQLTESENVLRRALEKMPDFLRAHRTLALALTRQQKHSEATVTWRKVITLGGGDAQSYGMLGYLYLLQNYYASAQTAYEQARMFAPESEDFKRGLAQCLLATGQHQRAVALFDELIEARPQERDYWLLQANAFIALERHSDATANLIVVTSFKNASAESWQLLGNLYLNTSLQEKALSCFLSALQAGDKPQPQASLRSFHNLLAHSNPSLTERYLVALKRSWTPAQLKEFAEPLAIAEADLFLANGKPASAIEKLQPIVNANPVNFPALQKLARAYSENNDTPKAVSHYERLLLQNEYKADALVELARLNVRDGDFKKALSQLREAQELKPRETVKRFIEQIEKAIARQN